METQTQEARIILAIEAIRSSKKMHRHKAAKLYRVPYSTLTNRINGAPPRSEYRSKNHNLTELEEEVLVRHILDIDERGFAPRLAGVEDMANYILESRGARRVGKLWAHRFVQRRPELKTRLNRVYDFQRALCEDPELISAWFQLVQNMRAKYGILDCDFYNFDETGFMMGVICAAMVVTHADLRGRGKAVRPGNREWATAITCINSEGWSIPPFLVVQGLYHLSSWYTETDLPHDWVIKPTSNGWTNNETGLDWIKHFDKHTTIRTKGRYRMLVLDGHESHESAAFQDYCKSHEIITISLPPHSSHLTQPLDVGCFSVLKRRYGHQIEDFIIPGKGVVWPVFFPRTGGELFKLREVPVTGVRIKHLTELARFYDIEGYERWGRRKKSGIEKNKNDKKMIKTTMTLQVMGRSILRARVLCPERVLH